MADAATLLRREWTVDGVRREALVYVPVGPQSNAAPLVFAFHGHGGSMQQAARSLAMHECWPEALVVYPQGLKTPGQITDPEGRRTGWQRDLGDQEDRDLKFFDAMLASLERDQRVDPRRVFGMGHSNGGALLYLLWAARGDRLAAVAPSGAATTRVLRLKPKPVLHVAGRQDPLVRFAWQERTITALRRINQCGAGVPWPEDNGCWIYPSPAGTPVVTYIHDGGHQYPRAASAVIAKFFQQRF